METKNWIYLRVKAETLDDLDTQLQQHGALGWELATAFQQATAGGVGGQGEESSHLILIFKKPNA